jgi:Alternative complex III, ActD subunit/Heat induced stress protein YflT domain
MWFKCEYFRPLKEFSVIEGVITAMATKTTLVTGLFKTRAAAEAAVDALMKRGYTRDEISVLMSDATRTKEFAVETRTHAADGAGIGGAVGGTVGAVLAAIAAVGNSIAIPGLGLVVAGPIAAALAGLGAGAATGGIVGALIGAGIPEHRARVYDAGIRSGGILLGVEARSDSDADNLEKLLGDLGAEHVRQE